MAAGHAASPPLTGGEPVGIVGAGPVAQALGRLLLERGEPVVALAGRNQARAAGAAAFIGPSIVPVALADLPRHVTRVLLAIADEGLTPVADALARSGLRDAVVLHTCGARGPDALAPLRTQGVACGVFHPLQTIRTAEQGAGALDGIAFGVAGDSRALEWAEQLARRAAGRTVRVAEGRFAAYHAGAVMASNSMNAMVDAAVVLLGLAGIDRRDALDAIGPLCRTSVANALQMGPAAALTGPVVRGDAGMVAAHLRAVADAPADVARLYRAAARHLVDLARQRGLPEADVRRLEALVDEENA